MLGDIGRIPEAIAAMERSLECNAYESWLPGRLVDQQQIIEWASAIGDHAKMRDVQNAAVQIAQILTGIRPRTYRKLRQLGA
jgi:hypothetical protein